MGKSAPASPNYQQAAQQQGASSQANTAAQTQANRPNQTNAFGAQSNWTQDPRTGQWTQSGSVGGPLGQGIFNLSSEIANQGPLETGEQARTAATNAAYNQATMRLDPQFRQMQQQTDAQLANQGLAPTSEASRAAQNQLSQERNDAYAGAQNAAVGQGLAAGHQAFEEGVQGQMMPYQDLFSLAPLTQQQGFAQAGRAEMTPELAAAMAQGNYQLPAWQAGNSANADLFSGGMQGASSLFQLAGAAGGG